MTTLCLALGAYLLGSISPAYLMGRWFGLDLRRSGSGNLGASNVTNHYGWRVGLAVGILDLVKSVFATVVGLALAGQTGGAVAGIATVAGHNWSVFLHFTGGRGLICSLTVMVLLVPLLGFLSLFVVLIGYAARQPAAATAIAFLTSPVAAWWLYQPSAAFGLTLSLSLLLFAKRGHANGAAAPPGSHRFSTLFWRLLCDRDIAQEHAWIQRRSMQGDMK